MINEIAFEVHAVEPIACLKNGWETIKDQYWLFVGMSLVGILLGSFVPFGIILGPMMCGLYLSLFQRRQGELVEFGTLFKGFDYFGQSVVATLLHLVPMLAVLVPFYIVFYIGFFVMMADARRDGGEPDPTKMFGLFGVFAVFWLLFMLFWIVLSALFAFAYPLIVDRKLSGLDAVKLSFRAALANFWRLLGLMLLNAILSLLGLLLCYVGVFLVLPITFAAVAAAYEQVFGLGRVQPLASPLPPPPPIFA